MLPVSSWEAGGDEGLDGEDEVVGDEEAGERGVTVHLSVEAQAELGDATAGEHFAVQALTDPTMP